MGGQPTLFILTPCTIIISVNVSESIGEMEITGESGIVRDGGTSISSNISSANSQIITEPLVGSSNRAVSILLFVTAGATLDSVVHHLDLVLIKVTTIIGIPGSPLSVDGAGNSSLVF